MRVKSRSPKVAICLRIKVTTLEKLDKIALSREEDRNEYIRKVLESHVATFSA